MVDSVRSRSAVATVDTGPREQPVQDARARARLRRMVPHPGVRQFGRYAIVGAGNTVLDSLVYAVLIHVGLGYVVAKLIAAAVALLNGFAFNRRWTFREPTARLKRLPRYVVVQAAGTGANLAVLVALVEGLSLNPLIGQLIALPAVAGITFVGNKLWTFSRTP